MYRSKPSKYSTFTLTHNINWFYFEVLKPFYLSTYIFQNDLKDCYASLHKLQVADEIPAGSTRFKKNTLWNGARYDICNHGGKPRSLGKWACATDTFIFVFNDIHASFFKNPHRGHQRFFWLLHNARLINWMVLGSGQGGVGEASTQDYPGISPSKEASNETDLWFLALRYCCLRNHIFLKRPCKGPCPCKWCFQRQIWLWPLILAIWRSSQMTNWQLH